MTICSHPPFYFLIVFLGAYFFWGSPCRRQAFSICCKQGLLSVTLRGLLAPVASSAWSTRASRAGSVVVRDFPGGLVVKTPAASAGDTGSIPGPGRFRAPKGTPLCLRVAAWHASFPGFRVA